MVIKWTPLARKSLHDIYLFYLPAAGKEKAKSIAQRIKDETEHLALFPKMGARQFADSKPTPYRCLVTGHCKVYYTVEPAHIRIAFVWDTRRNPQLLKKFIGI